ncbi:tyrosine-type recombinase/integrase [Anaerotignum sp.]|uniref:tyrosine-type recombinase/integrase n=1 Tax=Anaerotignum sp. TaxID=2039241 RepID=UPI00289A576C|nr:tyrosine-type recombinase/integrase [Anaerotignum sp.]
MGKDLKGKELGAGLRQKPNGMYSARYVDRFGKRQELYDRNLSDLKRKLNTAVYDDAQGNNVVDNSITLTTWFESWMEIHKYKVIRNNTKMHYMQIFEKHIKPTLGRKKLKEITQLNVKSLLKDLDKKGYKYETQNKVRIMLLDIFDKAMIDNYVIKNPCKGIKLVRDEKKDMRVLTREEQTEFFECCKGTFYDNLFVVAISTGLRQGELCALTWDDIDLNKKEITVNKTLLYQKLEGDSGKNFHTNPPKTKTSNRTVPITKQCELALKKQFIQRNNVMAKKSAKPLQGYENLLFVTKFGTPINDQIMIDALKRVLEEINLCRDELEQFEYFSPHCFRHSFATRCFEADVPPKTVQQFLGHATLQMTMDLYTHVLGNQKQEDMQKLENILDAVFASGDSIVEARFVKEKNNENKVIDISKVG